jgi:integrase
MRQLLNVKAIQSAKPRSKEYLLADGDGLFLRVFPTGRKTWIFMYSHGCRRRKLSIGDIADLSLAGARERATAERSKLSVGDDPRVALMAQEQQQASELAKLKAEAELREINDYSLRQMTEAWLSDGVSRRDGNEALRGRLERRVLRGLGAKPVRLIGEADLLEVLRSVGRKAGHNRTALALLADLRQLFRWAEKRRPWRQLLVDGNPADLVNPKQVVQPDYDMVGERDRVLSGEEIIELNTRLRQAWTEHSAAVDKRSGPRPLAVETELVLWIMLSTCCRIGELAAARWENLNLEAGEWLVPSGDTKTRRGDWLVLLSPFATRQFRALHGRTGHTAWCLPNADGSDHVAGKSISKQIGDRQFRFKKRSQLARRRNDNTLVLGDCAWTPHDLRRTGSTLMQALGVKDHIRERCLNHVVGGKIARVYGRYDYAAEKRQAWELLGDHLDTLLLANPERRPSRLSGSTVFDEKARAEALDGHCSPEPAPPGRIARTLPSKSSPMSLGASGSRPVTAVPKRASFAGPR